MNRIENIFLTSDINQENEPSQKPRIKMGEVFQLPNERYALVCIHCSDEFQYFSEFTLHVQEHFQQIKPTIDEIYPIAGTFIKTESDTAEDDAEPIEITGIDTQLRTETDSFELTSRRFESENTQTVDRCNDNQKFKVDNDYEDESFNDFSNDFGNDNSECEVEEKNKQIQYEEIKPIVSELFESSKQPKQVNEKFVEKSDTKSRPKRTKNLKKAIIEPSEVAQNYEKLLLRFTSSKEDLMDPAKFELFKAEKVDGLFPCTIKDTPEVRLMATLSLHTYKYEKIGREFLCPICTSSFPNPHSVRRHLFTHVTEPVFLCGFCPEKFRAIRYLRGHLNQKHTDESRWFECYLCHKGFQQNQFRALKDHIQTHLVDTMHCMLCNKKFKEFRFYQLHMLNIHPQGINITNEKPAPVQPVSYREKPIITTYECYVCKKYFRERRLLRSHMKLHVQQPRLCLVCGVFCSSATSLSRHIKLHSSDDTRPHICSICGKGFKVRQYLLRHRRKEHQLWADNTPPVCQICGAYFDKKSLLYEHMKTHPFEETRNFICTICNHAARNAYNLRRHLQTHSNDRSYVCPICHKNFHMRYAKDHMKSHTCPRKHKCPDCGKKFKRKYALKQHSYSHGGAPEHKCDICSRAFSRTDKLLRHRRRHGIPLNYHCKVCLKGFISQKSYQLHESSHMKSQTNEASEPPSKIEFDDNI